MTLHYSRALPVFVLDENTQLDNTLRPEVPRVIEETALLLLLYLSRCRRLCRVAGYTYNRTYESHAPEDFIWHYLTRRSTLCIYISAVGINNYKSGWMPEAMNHRIG